MGLVDAFWALTVREGRSFLTPAGPEQQAGARWSVHIFYLFLLFTILSLIEPDADPLSWQAGLALGEAFDPPWLIRWLGVELTLDWMRAIYGYALLSSFVCLIAWPNSRLVRLNCALAFLVVGSFISAFGAITHIYHVCLFAAFLLIGFPTGVAGGGAARAWGLRANVSIWSVQLLLLLTYSLSGVSKLLSGMYDLSVGRNSVFGPDALAYYAAHGNSAAGNQTLFGEWVAAHPGWWSVPIMVGGLLLECGSLAVAFYPPLHRTWAVALMVLHVANLLIVGPEFANQLFLVGLFLYFSPFTARAPVR